MDKNQLEALYRTHHEKGHRYGYLFCHGARSVYLQKWIGVGKKVLDLGCRDGMLTRAYAKGNEVVGVDIDREALKLCQAQLGIETQWIDLNQEWPFSPNSFDVVVACEILEHLYQMDQFLEKIASVLKPNGLFIGSVPNAFRIRNRLKFMLGREFETDPTHVRMFSYQKLRSVISQSFTNVEIVPIQGKILPFWKVSSQTPDGINRLFAKDLLWRATKS